MQVKKFPEGEWWRKDVYFIPNDLRNAVESILGMGRSALYGGDRYKPEEYAALERRFKGRTEYFVAGYSDYGGDILDRLVGDALAALHKTPEKKLTDMEREIVDGSACLGSAYGGEEWAVWHPALVADLKTWHTELYSRGLDWLEAMFRGKSWDDALCELEDRLRCEAVDNLVDMYRGLKDEEELLEEVREWFMNHGRVDPTMVDYSEDRLMMELVGPWVVNHHTKLSTTDAPLPFHWLIDEKRKALADAQELPDEEAGRNLSLQIDRAFQAAQKELGYAFARCGAEEWAEENRNFGWLPWNRKERK